jgi:hypothetical protein
LAFLEEAARLNRDDGNDDQQLDEHECHGATSGFMRATDATSREDHRSDWAAAGHSI